MGAGVGRKREVCFHSPNTTLSGIFKKLFPPSEGSLTREIPSCIPLLVPDPAPVPYPGWVPLLWGRERFISLGISEAPLISPYIQTS